MFVFEKRTQIPVCIKNRNPRLAGIILEQYGGSRWRIKRVAEVPFPAVHNAG